MRNLLKAVAVVSAILVSYHSLAFNPPKDSKDGLTLEILDVDKEEPVGTPLAFKVRLTNESPSNITGQVKVWLNDDWSVDGDAAQELSVPAGESRTLQYNANSGPRVLYALYPVHALFTTPCETVRLHPIAIFMANVDHAAQQAEMHTVAMRKGVQRLDSRNTPRRVFVGHKGAVRELGVNFSGSDEESRASFSLGTQTRGGVSRRCINVHPPYSGGTGAVWADYAVSLPEGEAAKITFHTAIRDSHAQEGASDGVEFKVFAVTSDGSAKELFSRFSAAKVWESADISLDDYAGQTFTLRLWSGPGPNNNTSCDSAFWGDPSIICGDGISGLPAPEQWNSREVTAKASAEQALKGDTRAARGRFQLDVRGETFGAAVVPGPQGLTDAVIAFTDGKETLIYRGFQIDIDQTPVGAVEMGAPVVDTEYRSLFGKLTITHHVSLQSGVVEARATVYADDGALRIDWDMPDADRDERGEPRYTRLAIGPCSATLKRVYAGFGNVIEYPESFSLGGGGFTVSARHVGADYENGLSLLQASTVFPDRAVYNKGAGHFALETPHDSGFFFVPSGKGAFAAARAYRDVCGFKRSPGWGRTVGRMCLDQWGGDYAKAAEGLQLAGKYGLNDSIFVKHVWQRWGYDYRLQEIYPPAGSFDDFMTMRQAAKDAGIIFAPHDNYIDFYPDAEGYSYDHIIFNADGTPQKAWYNKGRDALSYRWLPHALQPWMKENMRLMREGFKPDGLFIDVFTAMAPKDYFDRDGNFYTRDLTAELWGDAFNTCRRMLKWGSPMISEAGTDALIGSIDAGQADHFHARRWMSEFKESCRTPWHDMASHGSMILLAGGLGSRYSAVDWHKVNRPEHGYGSDDYLSNTIIGGRNPMCDGPFSRNAVATYWLLHDICDELAREEFETHEFGDTILQQHTTFGKNGKVWSNRGEEPWTVNGGRVLPRYGFYAENGATRAGIITLDGQRAAFAQSDKAVFVDARPVFEEMNTPKLSAEVTDGKYLGDGKYSFTVKWEVIEPGIPNCKAFLHFDPADKDLDMGDNIAFQCGLNFPLEKLNEKCAFETTTTFSVPKDTKPGKYAIRFGLYNPNRIKIAGNFSGSDRVKGGIITVAKKEGQFTEGSWENESYEKVDLAFLQRNTEGKILDFGLIKTDGAFRVVFKGSNEWMLIPLPQSRGFTAELDLKKLGAKSDSVKTVTVVESMNEKDSTVEWKQEGDILSLTASGRAFGYKIRF